jgi:hypothetical protein
MFDNNHDCAQETDRTGVYITHLTSSDLLEDKARQAVRAVWRYIFTNILIGQLLTSNPFPEIACAIPFH